MIPVAKCEILIRRPVSEVFEAFVDPTITSHFWFSKGNGRLERGKKVRWDWEMYGVRTNVTVKAIDVNRRILIEWNGPENPSEVEWTFEPRDGDRTWVTVENRSFSGTLEAQVKEALNATEGFTFLLGGAKIWLEHGIEPRFVLDHWPEGLVAGETGSLGRSFAETSCPDPNSPLFGARHLVQVRRREADTRPADHARKADIEADFGWPGCRSPSQDAAPQCVRQRRTGFVRSAEKRTTIARRLSP